MSVLCPGKSTENRRFASGESFDFVGAGMLYTSIALEARATRTFLFDKLTLALQKISYLNTALS